MTSPESGSAPDRNRDKLVRQRVETAVQSTREEIKRQRERGVPISEAERTVLIEQARMDAERAALEAEAEGNLEESAETESQPAEDEDDDEGTPIKHQWFKYPAAAGAAVGIPAWKAGSYVLGGVRNKFRNTMWRIEKWGFRSLRGAWSGTVGEVLGGLGKLTEGTVNLILAFGSSGKKIDLKWGDKHKDRYKKIMSEDVPEPPWKKEEEEKKKKDKKDKKEKNSKKDKKKK